jgi:hypothetical protein
MDRHQLHAVVPRLPLFGLRIPQPLKGNARTLKALSHRRTHKRRGVEHADVAQCIELEADEGKSPKTRLDWPLEFKDEALSRLLALNVERAAAERAAGLTPSTVEDDEELDDEDAE